MFLEQSIDVWSIGVMTVRALGSFVFHGSNVDDQRHDLVFNLFSAGTESSASVNETHISNDTSGSARVRAAVSLEGEIVQKF